MGPRTCELTGCRARLHAGGGDGRGQAGAETARLLYVTDPLCSGCWALEPAWRRLIDRYGAEFSISYVYGGLLPSWEGFADPRAGISVPADVAAHWEAVSRASGQPIDSRVWLNDRPASSYPASIAAAAVRLVAPEQEGRYLRRLRELVFLERQNIARPEVLYRALGATDINVDGWRAMLDSGAAERAFAVDRLLARGLGVRVFPTLLLDGGEPAPRLVAEGSLRPGALERGAAERSRQAPGRTPGATLGSGRAGGLRDGHERRARGRARPSRPRRRARARARGSTAADGRPGGGVAEMSPGPPPDAGGACATLARMLEEQPARLPRRLRRIVHDPKLAEDLSQEAVARAGGNLCRLRAGPDEALLCAWLDRIARNLAFNHLRDSSRRPFAQPLETTRETELPATTEDAAANLLLADTRWQLRDVLEQLPAELADVVIARLIQERSTADTAQRLGISEALVKWRLHRARARLRERLDSKALL
jgi:RNA polymerase sigma factor (sigma-70 family)